MTRETAHDVEARRKIQQTPPDKHPCPKCGSEMADGFMRSKRKPYKSLYDFKWCPKCGHEEKVKGEK